MLFLMEHYKVVSFHGAYALFDMHGYHKTLEAGKWITETFPTRKAAAKHLAEKNAEGRARRKAMIAEDRAYKLRKAGKNIVTEHKPT